MTHLTLDASRIVAHRPGQREVVLAIVPAAYTARIVARTAAHVAIQSGAVQDWRRMAEVCGLITREHSL